MTDQGRVSNEVFTVETFKERLQEGWELHVVCSEDPVATNTVVRGSWYLVGVEPESGKWAVLVTQRDLARERRKAREQGGRLTPSDYAYREIKTNTGLFNVQKELGISACVCPGAKGMVMVATAD